MIVFKKVKYKNFLSTGNKFTEIDLAKNKSTLIVGQNGSGKSTILDAISFSLFGKPHRNINKPQLVNSINKKDCVVEVHFSVNNIDYKVIRGIKPGFFEIWKGDVMLNQTSHAREYQKILEQNILKLNHKSFHQVVVLGSSSFIPFMQLASHHRRDVIEDILDIGVFSKMSQIMKERVSILRERIKDNDFELEVSKNKIESHKKYIRDLTSLSQTNINKKKESIDKIKSQIEKLQNQNADLLKEIENIKPEATEQYNKLHDKRQDLLNFNHRFGNQHTQISKDLAFFKDNDECPTCSQAIDYNFKEHKIDKLESKLNEVSDAIIGVRKEAGSVEDSLREITKTLDEMTEKQNVINSNIKSINSEQDRINDLQQDIDDTSTKDIKNANEELKDLESRHLELNETKFKYWEERDYQNIVLEMLKDTGIKTKIIKQYLPVINKFTNEYLQILDFFVHFNLDESFQETIRSRHRDAFTYDSFSEGEKQRIDLALLFTWRQIAKMKNSISTNLLILDETFDSSLDHDGIDNLLKILDSLEDNTNTFVISHKGEVLDGRFKAKIEFQKHKNFSAIKNGLQMEESMV